MKSQVLIFSLFLIISTAACGQIDKNADQVNTTSEVSDSQKAVVHVINVQEFKSKLELPDAQIIDVRTDAEVAEGMIPNAVQMDVAEWNGFVVSVESLDPDKPVLVYCRSGGRSNRAATYLVEKGFTEVYDLSGGITDWNRNNEEIVKP
ncbi:rhodanese-like domain-containing protein [Cryomorpha ignava]|uniref:Rhodanese-like domain-containing protein n=1 Tax=Cryomorpha ignava TaxID=101383 RepID=A0A7K3WYE5_9FLAO|nr:rhodanese-like domain-containing protein [Cryomorpha ignava]NEN25685.1 rhodanese-like domain-containing protein [Cryomorpha ignava]